MNALHLPVTLSDRANEFISKERRLSGFDITPEY